MVRRTLPLKKIRMSMNRRLEKIWWTALGIAEISIVGWVVFGWNGKMEAGAWSLLVGGVAAFVALGALGLKALRERNGVYE